MAIPIHRVVTMPVTPQSNSIYFVKGPPSKIVVTGNGGDTVEFANGSNGGAGSVSYEHVQNTATGLWTVAHNLGFRPTVTVTTTGGLEVAGGEVVHLSLYTLTIEFDVAFSGRARCT